MERRDSPAIEDHIAARPAAKKTSAPFGEAVIVPSTLFALRTPEMLDNAP